MTDSEKKSFAERYELSRDQFRSKALRSFLGFHQKSNQFIAAMNEVVASHMLYSSGKDWSQIEAFDIRLAHLFGQGTQGRASVNSFGMDFRHPAAPGHHSGVFGRTRPRRMHLK